MQRSDCLTARRLERQFDDGTRDVLFSPTHSLWIEQDEKKPNRWELIHGQSGKLVCWCSRVAPALCRDAVLWNDIVPVGLH
jgi:hypothetical protein